MAQERAIWDLYEDENPNVSITMTPINEDVEAAYQARVAAGNPAHIRVNIQDPNKENYDTFVDLRGNPDIEWWDLLTYDGQTAFEGTHGVAAQPTFNARSAPFRGLAFHANLTEEIGIDPKSWRSADDMFRDLALAKAYVDANDDLDNVIDTAWHPWWWGWKLVEMITMASGHSKEELRQVYAGEASWTDESGPIASYLTTVKRLYDEEYLPEQFWKRDWETEYEPSIINGRAVFGIHGPWIFAKVSGANPDANLDFAFWPSNEDGKVWADGATSEKGAGIYKVYEGTDIYPEILKAFNWWNSPEIVKLRAEALGFPPLMDLSSVGGANLTDPQSVKAVLPVLNGEVDGVSFDFSISPRLSVARYKVKDTPWVFFDNETANLYADYLEDGAALGDILAQLEARWEAAFDIPTQ